MSLMYTVVSADDAVVTSVYIRVTRYYHFRLLVSYWWWNWFPFRVHYFTYGGYYFYCRVYRRYRPWLILVPRVYTRHLSSVSPDEISSDGDGEPLCGAPGELPCMVQYPAGFGGYIEAACLDLHIPMTVCEPPPPGFSDCDGGTVDEDGTTCIYKISITEEL